MRERLHWTNAVEMEAARMALVHERALARKVFEEGFQQSNAAEGPAADLTTSETKIPNYILKFP